MEREMSLLDKPKGVPICQRHSWWPFAMSSIFCFCKIKKKASKSMLPHHVGLSYFCKHFDVL